MYNRSRRIRSLGERLAKSLCLHVRHPPRRRLRRVVLARSVGLFRDASYLGDLVTVQVSHVPRRVTPPQLSARDERPRLHPSSSLNRRILLDVRTGFEHGPGSDDDVILDDGGGDGAVGADGDVLTDARSSPGEMRGERERGESSGTIAIDCFTGEPGGEPRARVRPWVVDVGKNPGITAGSEPRPRACPARVRKSKARIRTPRSR